MSNSFAFERAFQHLVAQAAHALDAPNDFGVTAGMLEEWRPGHANADSLRALSADDARKLYRDRYWRVFKGDALPPSIAVILMDAAPQIGNLEAVKTLQKSCNSIAKLNLLRVDGRVGPHTIEAVRSFNVQQLLNECVVQRGAALAVRKAFTSRNLDWARRLMDAARLANSLVRPPPMELAGSSRALPAAISLKRHFFNHSGHGVMTYGSFFELWGGWVTAAHVMEDMLDINPPFALGEKLHRPSGLDVTLIGCSLPRQEPSAPSKGQALVVAGYPWGTRHAEIRECEALYQIERKDLRTGGYNSAWTARILAPEEPVVSGMSGGVVYDAHTFEVMGVLTTANHAADFDQDGVREQSCDFVSLDQIWSATNSLIG